MFMKEGADVMTEKSKKKSSESKIPINSRGFHIEIDSLHEGYACVLISGVKKIACFSPETISLMMKDGKARVDGAELIMNVYENRRVEISGRIGGVYFEK